MGKRIIEDPVTTVNNDPLGGTETTHPAYAQIRASRVSGHANLYGSEFHHNGFITITICKSKLNRSLSRDWQFGQDELISVALSEAQWATFVSSLNCGSGVPCTLEHINCETVPGLPDPVSRQDQFDAELMATMQNSHTSLTELADKVLAMKISAKLKEELLRDIHHTGQGIGGSAKFVAKSFSEHMETQTENAKCEVNAYVIGQIHQAGLTHLQETAALQSPLMIEEKK